MTSAEEVDRCPTLLLVMMSLVSILQLSLVVLAYHCTIITVVADVTSSEKRGGGIGKAGVDVVSFEVILEMDQLPKGVVTTRASERLRFVVNVAHVAL